MFTYRLKNGGIHDAGWSFGLDCCWCNVPLYYAAAVRCYQHLDRSFSSPSFGRLLHLPGVCPWRWWSSAWGVVWFAHGVLKNEWARRPTGTLGRGRSDGPPRLLLLPPLLLYKHWLNYYYGRVKKLCRHIYFPHAIEWGYSLHSLALLKVANWEMKKKLNWPPFLIDLFLAQKITFEMITSVQTQTMTAIA